MNRLLFAALVVAGCAGASPTQTQTPDPTGTEAEAGSGSGSGADAGMGASTDAGTAPVATPGPMKTPTATAYAAELQAIGLDPEHLPPLNKIAPEQLRKVMPLVAKSLGVKCNACHNFASDTPQTVKTPRMKVAEHMWNDFVRIRTISDGTVFCDSCHHGSLTFLDRHDRPTLEHWMDESFVKTLGAEHCETCHGTPPRWKFIDLWRR